MNNKTREELDCILAYAQKTYITVINYERVPKYELEWHMSVNLKQALLANYVFKDAIYGYHTLYGIDVRIVDDPEEELTLWKKVRI